MCQTGLQVTMSCYIGEAQNHQRDVKYLYIRSSKTCANHLIESQEDFLLHLSHIVVAGIDLVLAKHATMQGLLSFNCSSKVLEGHKHKANSCCHLHSTAAEI